jgi:hypothetical protein
MVLSDTAELFGGGRHGRGFHLRASGLGVVLLSLGGCMGLPASASLQSLTQCGTSRTVHVAHAQEIVFAFSSSPTKIPK